MSEKQIAEAIWASIVAALRAEIARAEAAKIARSAFEALWDKEGEKSAEEAVHNNMHPQRWA